MATTRAINYHHHHLLGAPAVGSGVMAQYFSSMLKPAPSTDEAVVDQARRVFPIWIGHEGISNNLQEMHQNHHHQLGAMNPGTVYNTEPPPSDHTNNHQSPWMFGNKLSSSPANNPEGLTSTTSISLPISEVKENGPHHQVQITIPSLFSTNQMVQTTAANMSATALLQKAAQIGATSTDASFLGSFNLKSNRATTPQDVEDGSKYSTLPFSNNSIGRSHEQHLENSPDISTLNQLQLHPPPAKRQHTQNEESTTAARGQTRDFFGVGMQTMCHPSSINGWI